MPFSLKTVSTSSLYPAIFACLLSSPSYSVMAQSLTQDGSQLVLTVPQLRLTGAPVYASTPSPSRTHLGSLSSSHQLIGMPGRHNRTLVGLSIVERNNRPCGVRAHIRTTQVFRNSNSNRRWYYTPTHYRCGNKSPIFRSKDFAGVTGSTVPWDNSMRNLTWPPMIPPVTPYFLESGEQHIGGLKACIRNGKIKGIEVSNRIVDRTSDTGNLISGNNQPDLFNLSMKRQGCSKSDWTSVLRCPSETVAVAVVAHFNRFKTPDNLSGLQLLCRTVVKGPDQPLIQSSGSQSNTSSSEEPQNNGRD